MQKSWKENKALLVLLGTAVLIIWGYNLSQITKRLTQEENPTETSTLQMPEVPSTTSTPDTSLPFSESVHDPFEYPYKRPKAQSEKTKRATDGLVTEKTALPPTVATPQSTPDIPPDPPPFILMGTAHNTAILRGGAGKVHVLQAGQMVEGVRIISIKTEAIEVFYSGKKHIIKLSS